MPLPATVNLDAYHGDSWAQTFRFLEGAVPVDLTNSTVAAWATNFPKTEVVELAATITDPLAGQVTIAVGTEPLPAGKYVYDVEVSDAGEVKTWVRGQLTVVQDVTNP